jgi:AcrR family transcriptional regulator
MPAASDNRDAPGQRRASQKAETRARILQCALESFAARGFAGASVRDIAAAAKVNHGLIRYHFGDKDGLWKAAVTFLFERLHEEIAIPAADAGLNAYEQTRARLRRYVAYCARHPEHARIMVQESIGDSERLRWAVEHFIGPDHEELARTLERLMAEGVYPRVPLHSLVYIVSAAAQNIFMLAAEVRHSYGIDVSDPAVVEAHADTLLTLLFEHRTRHA